MPVDKHCRAPTINFRAKSPFVLKTFCKMFGCASFGGGNHRHFNCSSATLFFRADGHAGQPPRVQGHAEVDVRVVRRGVVMRVLRVGVVRRSAGVRGDQGRD